MNSRKQTSEYKPLTITLRNAIVYTPDSVWMSPFSNRNNDDEIAKNVKMIQWFVPRHAFVSRNTCGKHRSMLIRRIRPVTPTYDVNTDPANTIVASTAVNVRNHGAIARPPMNANKSF